jgi:hypothetical protein
LPAVPVFGGLASGLTPASEDGGKAEAIARRRPSRRRDLSGMFGINVLVT